VKLKKINLDLIKVPETRVTAVYDEEQAKLLRDTVEKLGILTPVILTKAGEQYLLVDGLHRLQEARAAGDATIDAVVYEGEVQDSLLMNLVLNRVRGKVKASEMVTVIEALTKEYGMDSDQIREKTGLPREYIEKLWRIAEAAPSVREALDMEVITVGHAYEISRLPEQIQQDEVIAKLQVWHMPVKDVKQLIDMTLAAMANTPKTPVHADPAPVIKYHCHVCSGEMEAKEAKPVLLCPQCFGELWRSVQRKQTPPASPLLTG